ncbi:hypothetical protein FJZ19_03330 [Candidatus Pacearchaeota archaeon]|nr:hypothetical protein [Candidatus Pacearchaeota archaeon]
MTEQTKDDGELERLVRELKSIPAEEMNIRRLPHGVCYTNNQGARLSIVLKSLEPRYREKDGVYLGNDVRFRVRIRTKNGKLLLQSDYFSYVDNRNSSLGERLYDVINGKMWEVRFKKEEIAEQSKEKRTVDAVLERRRK